MSKKDKKDKKEEKKVEPETKEEVKEEATKEKSKRRNKRTYTGRNHSGLLVQLDKAKMMWREPMQIQKI